MNLIKLNRRFGILTISSVFLLLLAGGFVRSTGSGMGCPDWPKCYDKLYPPTCECELPDNYQALYVEKRVKKAEKFSKLIASLGFKKEAALISNDPNLYTPEIFNTRKAWTEYINRIIGVLSGLFSLVFFVTLIRIRKSISTYKFWAGIIGFVLMLFNGWLGSIVVATNLFPILITIHYLAAYAVLAFFIISLHQASNISDLNVFKKYRYFFLFFVMMSLLQVVFGTQLRHVTDEAIAQNKLYLNNEVNYDFMGMAFKKHWVFAILIILISLIPVITLRKKINRKHYYMIVSITLLLVIQYVSGVLNLRFDFPLIPQVSHILFAGLVFGISLYLCLSFFKCRKVE
jgi:heme a synthase